MVSGPNRHDGRNYGGACSTFYDGEICFRGGHGACTPMTKGEAFQFAIDILTLLQEMEDD